MTLAEMTTTLISCGRAIEACGDAAPVIGPKELFCRGRQWAPGGGEGCGAHVVVPAGFQPGAFSHDSMITNMK